VGKDIFVSVSELVTVIEGLKIKINHALYGAEL
jgi:hypothetical protein